MRVSKPTDGEPREDARAWLAPAEGPEAPGEPLEDAAGLRVRRALGWFRITFLLGSGTVLLMAAAVALVLTHATTATPPIAAPAAPAALLVVPVVDVDWPGYAPDAALTGGAPSRGGLSAYQAVAEQLIGDPTPQSLGYTVWAAVDDDGTLDFDRDPHGIVTFDFRLSSRRCVRSTIGRGHGAAPDDIPCDGEPLTFPLPELAPIIALARATCPALAATARPRITVSSAFRWRWVTLVDPSLPTLSFSAIATSAGGLRGQNCGSP